jgi:hypothetical protein
MYLNSGCGGTSIGTPEIASPWPPDRPVLVQPPEVDQGTIIKYIFLIRQPGWSNWAGFHPDQRDEVWGALSAIYFQAKKDNDQVLMSGAIHSMGATGIVEFLPTILEAFDIFEDIYKPTVMSAMSGMPSDYAVYTLLQYINDGEFRIRKAVVWSLGNFKYYDIFPVARNYAINGLLKRLPIEQNLQIRENIEESLEKLLGDLNRT